MTRAQELLLLSGGVDTERWPAPRAGGPPVDWIVPALVEDPAGVFTPATPDSIQVRPRDGRPARLRCAFNAPATLDVVLPRAALAPAERPRSGGRSTALPAPPGVLPPPPRPRPAPQRLSYSALGAYARCGYRFYLQRILGLPNEPVPAAALAAWGEETEAAAAGEALAAAAPPALDPRVRGVLAHLLLEALDFSRPEAPAPEVVAALGADEGLTLGPAEVEDLRSLVMAVAASPLRERLAGARRVRREAPFAFAAGPGTHPPVGHTGPLITGFLDVLAEEPDGGVLIVDYKSDRLDGGDPAAAVEQGYATQRLIYALAGLRHGAPRVEVAYIFLEQPEAPVSSVFTAADAPALGERLDDLARGVLDERWPVAATPHRDLCGDCPGRRALCSWPEAMTLRPAADAYASAGSFSGSSGPS
jgi:ATP-dependent exoDNAse (exonuclease V) beta subunit